MMMMMMIKKGGLTMKSSHCHQCHTKTNCHKNVQSLQISGHQHWIGIQVTDLQTSQIPGDGLHEHHRSDLQGLGLNERQHSWLPSPSFHSSSSLDQVLEVRTCQLVWGKLLWKNLRGKSLVENSQPSCSFWVLSNGWFVKSIHGGRLLFLAWSTLLSEQ